MRLTPSVFMWANVCRFREIGRPLIQGRVQVVGLYPDAVRDTVVIMAGVVVRV